MESPCFLSLALDSLEVVKTAFAGDLTLKLLKAIERHARCVGSARKRIRRLGKREKKEKGRGEDTLIGVEYFAGLVEIKDLSVGI